MSQKAPSGEEVITLDLDHGLVEPTQNVTPEVSVHKSQSGRGVKRFLSYASTSNTAVEYKADNTVSHDVFYPTYLSHPTPSNLKIEELCRHTVISEIKKNDAMCSFFEVVKGILGPLKNVLLVSAGKDVPDYDNVHDHMYQSQDPTK